MTEDSFVGILCATPQFHSRLRAAQDQWFTIPATDGELLGAPNDLNGRTVSNLAGS